LSNNFGYIFRKKQSWNKLLCIFLSKLLAVLKFEARLEQGLGLKVPDGGQLPLQHHMHGGLVLRQALPPAIKCCQLHARFFSARQQLKGNKFSLLPLLPCQLPEEPSAIKLKFSAKFCFWEKVQNVSSLKYLYF
jgi:hypothetical protein